MLNLVGFAMAALGCVIRAAQLEHRTGLPSVALLVLIGLVYGFLPGPNVTLEPDLVLVLVLPLLLYSAALNASLLEIRANLRSVASLSVVLVLIMAVVTGTALSAVVPGLPLAAALALGAAVAPTDPVAALAVARRAGLDFPFRDLLLLCTFVVVVVTVVGRGATFRSLSRLLNLRGDRRAAAAAGW
jgi:CPA1 family monovalent cation:H+ antiporter